MNEYEVNEEDLKGGGTSKAKPIGNYDGVIEQAESKVDSNNRPYIKFRIGELAGPQKSGFLFENYLPFGRRTVKSGKNAGKEMLDARTVSFLRSTGQKNGVPIGAPGGRPASDLNGTYISVRLEHSYGDNKVKVPGHQYGVETWQKDFKDIEASGVLEGIDARESLGFYEMSDSFEGIGASSDDSNVAADGEWG